MKKISAEIVADSINVQGDRITTMLLTYPRFIHSELLTHRVFSKNSASSRAIPFEKMVKMVEEDPFIPIAWQKDHKGMQGTEYFSSENGDNVHRLTEGWLMARDSAVQIAKGLHNSGVTKQLCNRLLEPFMWHTVLLTGTEFNHFFDLRCPKYGDSTYGEDKCSIFFKSKKDYCEYFNIKQSYQTDIQWYAHNYSQAEIHMQALAEAMWDALQSSIPNQLNENQWHIPFKDKINDDEILQKIVKEEEVKHLKSAYDIYLYYAIKIATARCARLSYNTFDGEIDYEKDIKLHDSLLESHHMSPFEHCARAMSDEEYHSFYKGELNVFETSNDWYTESFLKGNKNCGWCNNFKGFIQYRYLVENEKFNRDIR